MRGGKRALALGLMLAALGGSLYPVDHGLLVSLQGEGTSEDGAGVFNFTLNLVPWFSAVLGEKTTLYLSGRLGFTQKGESWEKPVVELDRSEVSIRPIAPLRIVIGRQRYRDGGGMIAAGNYDGLSGSYGLGKARLTAGVFYTGLLYKESARILMTARDKAWYREVLDYGEPETYTASRRLVLTAGGELPDLTERLSLNVLILSQFDLNKTARLHSQYLEINPEFEAHGRLRISAAGIAGLSEAEGADPRMNFAGTAGLDWEVPGAVYDLIQTRVNWGSGAVSGNIGSFMPINSITQGTIFTPTLTGTMNVRLSYTVRPEERISVKGEGGVYWRTDRESFQDGELDMNSQGRFLGGELGTALTLAPDSAIRFTLGGGVFIPSEVFREGTRKRWKVNTGFTLSM
jgi:hypothetical protein